MISLIYALLLISVSLSASFYSVLPIAPSFASLYSEYALILDLHYQATICHHLGVFSRLRRILI
jgi:hypothetical protein